MAVGGARPMGLSRSTAMGHVPASLSKPARIFEVRPPPPPPHRTGTHRHCNQSYAKGRFPTGARAEHRRYNSKHVSLH